MFCKWIAYHKKGHVVQGGKGLDILNQLAQRIDETKKKPNLVIIDYPRCIDGCISYNALEQIKNGHFYPGKYKGNVEIIMRSPMLVIFANWLPILDKMSEDKWKIIKLT